MFVTCGARKKPGLVVLIRWEEREEFELLSKEWPDIGAVLLGYLFQEGNQLHQLVVSRVHEPETNRLRSDSFVYYRGKNCLSGKWSIFT